MCCTSGVAGVHDLVVFYGLQGGMNMLHFMGCKWASTCCILWVADGHEHVVFHGLQVGMNMLHFMGCRWA